jgi:hypothetical protein
LEDFFIIIDTNGGFYFLEGQFLFITRDIIVNIQSGVRKNSKIYFIQHLHNTYSVYERVNGKIFNHEEIRADNSPLVKLVN